MEISISNLFLFSLLFTLSRYLGLSALFLWFFNKKGNPWRPGWVRTITPESPRPGQLQRELAWGVRSCVVLAAVGAVAMWAILHGHTRMYFAVATHGWAYFLVSFLVLALAHDAYFFWTHFFMHRWRWFYRHVHFVHHGSKHPTPFADLSFHPLEAFIQGIFIPLMILLMPLHPAVVIAYLTFVSLMNAIGHTGFELFPKQIGLHLIGRFLSTPTNHAQHHLTPGKHLGLYIDLWDRWCGTHLLTSGRQCSTLGAPVDNAPELPNSEHGFKNNF